MSTQTGAEIMAEKKDIPSNSAARRARRYKKQSPGRKAGKAVGRILLVIFTFLIAVVLALGITIKMICSDAYPSAQKMFVTTVLESGQLKFLAGLFLSPEQVQAIVEENSMKELNAEVNTDLISFADAPADQKDIEVEEVAGATFTGTMMIIKDPSRLSVASIYPWKAQGIPLEELCLQDGAIAGINGGLYNSHNNSGGNPYGVLVSRGEIQYNKTWEWPGLVLIGFTEDNILEIIDINGYKADQIEELVKTRKIRDAVTFQEEASDANNHFVQLIINGESREMNGQGSGLNPRTAIGQRADGSVLLFVTDGRGKAGHLGASSGDLISVMEQYGAVNAANLDGGSSSCMWYNGEYLMTSVTFYYSNSSWKLPAGFVVH